MERSVKDLLESLTTLMEAIFETSHVHYIPHFVLLLSMKFQSL